MRIKETVEFFNEATMEIVKKRSHYIPFDYPSFREPVDFFEDVVKAFLAKRKKARSILDLVEREKVDDKKSVITISPVLNIEYAQRWTYELV